MMGKKRYVSEEAALLAANVERNGQAARQSEPWDQPLPLDSLPPVPPFPTDNLPDWLKRFVVSLATATQTPPDLNSSTQ